MSDRLREKHTLLMKLGALFGPLEQLVAHPNRYDEQERAETLARYFAEFPMLAAAFEQFSTGQPGHNYKLEHLQFYNALDGVRGSLQRGEELDAVVARQLSKARAAIERVPVPRTSVILEAGTPFTAYVRLRELCEVDATKSLIWVDPYVSLDLFHRFLAGVKREVPITLVTREIGPDASKREQAKRHQLLDVSRLFAEERGPSLYRLVMQPTLHDRWVILDDKRIYQLGGSAKDAAVKDYFTITSVEGSDENLAKVRAQIDSGVELFGPKTPSHP